MHLFWSSLICFWQVLDAISPFLVLGISFIAVYIAIQSRREARVAAQENLFYQLTARYSSPEMHGALEIIGELFDVRNHDKAAFLKVVEQYRDKKRVLEVPWEEKVEGGSPRSQLFYYRFDVINLARRQVSNFFTYSFDLLEKFKVLDDVYFKGICCFNTFKFLYLVIEWLELARNPKYDREMFTKLLEKSGRKDKDFEALKQEGITNLSSEGARPQKPELK